MNNFVENLIGKISPEWALRRETARTKMKLIDISTRRYEAATKSRRGAGWMATGADANTQIAFDISTLRNRSREMVRNNPYVSRAAKLIPATVCGRGIRPSISGGSKRAVDQAKAAWKKWAESKKCDLLGQRNFYGLQKLVMRSVVISGEVFIRRIRNAKTDIPFQLQVLESDFLATEKHGIETDGGGFIIMGVEFDKVGRIVAYWMHTAHPGANMVWRKLEPERIPASEIIHVFDIERPGQVRGVPFGVASMLRLRDFDEFEDAHLIRQKIAACFSVFISGEDELMGVGETDENDIPLEKVEPGIIEHLPAGKQVHFADPPTVQDYQEYTTGVLRGAAGGYHMPYENFTGDLSNVNFSSGRMGKLDFNKIVHEWQDDLIVGLMCEGVWEWFVEGATIAGIFNAKNLEITWTPPQMDIIDPQKEIKGMSEMVRNGFVSWQEMVRRQGLDPDTVIEQLKEDMERHDEIGLKLSSDARHDSNRQEDTTDPGEGKEDGGEDTKKPKSGK